MTNISKRAEIIKKLNEQYGENFEDRDIRFHETADAWVDLSYLPRHESGRHKGNVSWTKTNGLKIPFKFRNICGEFIIIKYVLENSKITLSYNDEILDDILVGNLIKVKIGRVLGEVKRSKTTEEFKQELKLINDKIDVVGEYVNDETPIDCSCKVCKHTWSPTPNKLLLSRGCPSCVGKEVCNYDYHNSLYYKVPNLVKNIFNIQDCFKYTAGCGKKINFICRDCYNIESKKILNITRKGFSCSRCGDGVSYPEKFASNLMSQLMNQYDITNVKREFTDSWTKNRRYDVVFDYNNKSYILEMDGSFHKKDNKMNGQTVEESQAIDREKDLMAIGQGMKIIRIDCDYNNIVDRHEHIKNNIINSELYKIFDLSCIDWKDIELKSVESLQVKAWKLKRENEFMSITDMSKILNIHYKTVSNYLRNGDALGMCEHDKKDHIFKTRSIGTIFVEVDGVLYEKSFSSIGELARYSNKEFGENFDKTGIRVRVSKNDYFKKSKPYKNKYIFIKTPYGTTFEELQEQLNKQKEVA